MIHISENLYIKYYLQPLEKKTNVNFFGSEKLLLPRSSDLSSCIYQTNSYFSNHFGINSGVQSEYFGIESINYLIHRHKKNRSIDEAIKSVIVETANNVTSSLLDFSPIMMMFTMNMILADDDDIGC